MTRRLYPIAVALATCISLDNPARPSEDTNEYANIHRVAVVSAVGDTFTLFSKGLTIFGTHTEEVPITSWGIDPVIVDALSQALTPRFEVVKVNLDPVAVDSCEKNGDQCSAIPVRNDVDAYVIVAKNTAYDPASHYDVRGIGQMHSSLLGLSYDAIYAMYVVRVVDAKTGKLIDSGKGILSGAYGDYPPEKSPLPKAMWPESAAQMTDAQKDFAKLTAIELLTDSLPRALQAAGLTQPSPSR